MIKKIGVIALFAALLGSQSAETSWAQDQVVGVAYGETEVEALNEAYFEGFRSRLELVASDEASGQVGDRFRRDFERSNVEFRNRYFSLDTAERCLPEGARFLCEIAGQFNSSALRNDLAAVLGGQAYTFVASAAESDDPRASFVVDQLTGEFAIYNHRILFGASSREAIRNESANFSLAIYEASFSVFEFDRYLGRSNGSLTIRFRLLDLESGETLAVEPVVVTASVTGSNASANEAMLVEQLSSRGAVEIAATVNAEVATYADRRSSISEASNLAELGRSAFSVRAVGVNRRDRDSREFLRYLREALNAMEGVDGVETDFDASSETGTVVNFTAPADLNPDEMIDRFYEAFDYLDSFYADYFGQQEFEISY